MKKFFYLSAGLMCLAITLLVGFHIGSRSVQAQAPGIVVGVAAGNTTSMGLILENGDVWVNQAPGAPARFMNPAVPLGNFWTGAAPVPVSEQTWGSVKDAYKK